LKPLIFSTSRFPLSYAANMFVLTILNHFCVLPAQSIYIYINVLSVCVHVPLCPQISESASPMALEFGHKVAGEYARVEV
jgi:hypothetical protein